MKKQSHSRRVSHYVGWLITFVAISAIGFFLFEYVSNLYAIEREDLGVWGNFAYRAIFYLIGMYLATWLFPVHTHKLPKKYTEHSEVATNLFYFVIFPAAILVGGLAIMSMEGMLEDAPHLTYGFTALVVAGAGLGFWARRK